MIEKKPDSRGRIPTSIKINPNLWKEAKIEAINQNIDLSELVEKALDAWIGKYNKKRDKND
ncbi:hypothetical protein [Candidatus Nitrosocosmicus sp. SS]|jgi:predicted HicB family RNase H-like nuclease|uniref:hypothetical protein n=1 Tax=Candidatus Nitrosocosmicus agrestis TaxID=2563600 RepID=UPI00122E9EDD|nr:hypothetical protein [Candidatus Nitrosocosmicus sp. SS]KAA2279068.1 hypothetical protein F1Z66_14420 [Candidatus Nitrosocosmicus sp. SS]KAF0867643.1 hypothetical protein E5N71_14195 [Candidatus Nitrosocosmicus sp. SS]